MSVNLAEFVLGKGYYETKYKDMIEDIDIDRLTKYLYRIENQPNFIPICSIDGPSLDDEYFTDIAMVWRIPHKPAKYSLKPHDDSYAVRKDLQVILKCCIEYGISYDYTNQFGIFTRLVLDRDYNNINVIMGKFVPKEIKFSDFEDYDEMTLTCYGYKLYEWYGKFSEIFSCHQMMLQKRELLLKSEMSISDARYEKFAKGLGDLFRFAPVPYLPDTVDDYKESDYVCKLPTTIELKANVKAFGEMVGSLKSLYEYDFLKKYKEVLSIELTNDSLSGGSNMNILDQLPKIKRLERNGAFTTAVWEEDRKSVV